MQLSEAEENYLKAIWRLQGDAGVYGKDLAERLNMKAGSVSEMLKRMADKNLVEYARYRPIRFTTLGLKLATQIVRRHRLWEVFLVEKLGFAWGQVHELAEQLEHVRSEELIDKLDLYLGQPRVDPHGDVIPDPEGQTADLNLVTLALAPPNMPLALRQVADDSAGFLQYLNHLGLAIGCTLEIRSHLDFDQSVEVLLGGQLRIIPNNIANLLLVEG